MAKKAWVISVDMGYGHQRAAYPLKDIAYERIITANSDKIVTPKEKKQWKKFRKYYEGLSRLRSVPLIGKLLWNAYDYFQRISPYYPFRDLSKPNIGSIFMHKLIRKKFLHSIVDFTEEPQIPFVTTFFAPALAAANMGRKNVYCIVTDTDINRIWAPEEPRKTNITYLAPTMHSKKRLMAYGVPEKNIFFTGFPLPKENIGVKSEVLKHDLGQRLANLDPKKSYISRYRETIRARLGKHFSKKSSRPLTLTFTVGGAGAQKEIGAQIIRSLRKKIKEHKIKVNLVAGTRIEIREYFLDAIEENNLGNELGKYVEVICELSKKDYFEKFNKSLRTTDILWTKPSELTFFVALGIPIIIAPPLGSHEAFNEKWLVTMGTGIKQEDPRYADEWLFEWINKGILAEAAWEGINEAPRYGTYNIENIIFASDKKKVKLKYF